MQDQPNNQPARHGNSQDPIPRQALGKAVQMRRVFGAVKNRLQRIDTFAEKQRAKPRGDADQKRDEPKLHL